MNCITYFFIFYITYSWTVRSVLIHEWHQKLGLSDQFHKCYQLPFEEILAEPKWGVEDTKLVLRGIEHLPRINVEEGVTDGCGDSGKGVHPELLSAHLPLIDG